VLAERGSDAHVADYGSGDVGRKAFRSIVTAGAILLKYAGSFGFMQLRSGIILALLRAWGLIR
jgi:hypothetical protein